MRITDEDRKLIGLIDAWGYLTVEDVCLMMGYTAQNSAVWRLKRLVESTEIYREKSKFGRYIYCAKDFRGLDIATYDHDQQVKRLAVAESKRLACEYMTIRQLRSKARLDLGVAGLTQKVPDLVLVKNGQKIAIELELSQKSLSRQRANIEKYITQIQKGEYKQVFYYCGSDAIKDRVNGLAAEKGVLSKIKATIMPKDF